MNLRKRWRRGIFTALLVPVFIGCVGCHSYHIDTTVENRTGGTIQLLEVNYPSASFGADSLVLGATFNYRFQVRGSGPLKVEYTASNHHLVQIAGPVLAEQQEGRIEIVLLPDGKAEFHQHLTGASGASK